MSTPTPDDVARVLAAYGLVPADVLGAALATLVDENKAREAAAVNGGGPERQVAYLLDAGNSAATVSILLGEALAGQVGTYTVAVYYYGDGGEWHYFDSWNGVASSAADARRRALDSLEETRIEGWKAEVTGLRAGAVTEDDDDDGES